MVVIKNWKKYYSTQEIKKMLNREIKKSAWDMIIELRKRREEKTQIHSKEFAYV